MTNEEYEEDNRQKSAILKEYNESQKAHRNVHIEIDHYTSWQNIINAHDKQSNEYKYFKDMVNLYTNELPEATKRKLLAIKDVRGKGYLKQHQIEY